MADTKITALTAITSITPATFPLPIVDLLDTTMAGSGTTKKVTVNQILGCGGTATLASATITGDLTVDTNVLKVDSTNNRLGIGTATPANTLEVVAPAGDNIVSTFRSGDATAANNAGGGFRSISSATAASRVAQVWLDADGANFSGGDYFYIQKNGNSGTVEFNQSSNAAMTFLINSTERMRIDSSGNVGIGVTPSAWNSDQRALQVSSSGSYVTSYISGATVNQWLFIGNNAFYDSVDSRWEYIRSKPSAQYIQYNNEHQWLRDTGTQTAGAACTFTQAMTLDASGNLLVGQTTQSVSTVGISLNSNGAIVGCVNDGAILYVNRKVSDGTLVSFLQDNTEEGTISVSGNTVSYNNFAGSHVSQLQDGSKTEILRGTVMESINELCVWPNEENERLPKSKISDTAGSKNVYGVFMAWDNEWTTTNDFLVTAVGAFICRVNGSITVQEGDLLESNGDGTARVQSDDIIRSSTIGKVTSTVKTYQYDDGSYCVPTVLYCG